MTALLFAVIASTAAVGFEALTKARPDATWLDLLLPWGIIAGFTVQYGVYRILHSGESLIGGLVLFSFCNAILRTGVTLFQGQEVSPVAWVAFALVTVAGVLKLVWA